MTARLYLDDALQAFTEDEMRFLKRVANALPKTVCVRACHDAKGLVFQVQVAFTGRATYMHDAAANIEHRLLEIRVNLAKGAQEAAAALQLQDTTVHQVLNPRTHCKKCGDSLLPRPGAKRRGETICPTCDASNTEDVVAQEAINRHALRVRRSR